MVIKESFYTSNRKKILKIFKYINKKKILIEMPKKSSIALFIAATSALAIIQHHLLNAGENDLGGLKRMEYRYGR